MRMDGLKYCLPVSSDVESKTRKHEILHDRFSKWDQIPSREKKIYRKLKKQSKLCFACAIDKQIRNEKHLNHFIYKHRKRFLFQKEKMYTIIHGIVLLCLITIFCSHMVSSANPNTMLKEEFTDGIFYNAINFVYYVSKWTLLFIVASFLFLWINANVNSPSNATERELDNLAQNTKKMFVDEEEFGLKQKILVKKMKYANILSDAIQIPTISYDATDTKNVADFFLVLKLHKLLRTSFPLLHRKYPPKVINKYSLLYKINGTDPTLKPILFCSHLDVVPAPNHDNSWVHDPFQGIIKDNVIWGRGAIDNKHNVVSQLGAVEELLINSIPIKRTLYIAMGHDEEVHGVNGAAKIAEYLSKNNIAFEFILDEGTMMVSNALPGYKNPIALIGNAEKGYITVEMKVTGPGGHSSQPSIKDEALVSIMGKAVTKISENPMPAHFGKDSMFRSLLEINAHKMPFPINLIYSNFWIFGPLMKYLFLNASNGAAASIRTTSAVVKILGGLKFNVLPSEVRAYINHRVHPLDTPESVLEHDRKVVNDDRIQMRILQDITVDPSPVSSTESKAFKTIQTCVSAVYNVISGPSLMIGNTDTRWYWNLSDNIFRFSPIQISVHDLSMFHGINERIGVDTLAEMVLFYAVLIQMCGDTNIME